LLTRKQFALWQANEQHPQYSARQCQDAIAPRAANAKPAFPCKLTGRRTGGVGQNFIRQNVSTPSKLASPASRDSLVSAQTKRFAGVCCTHRGRPPPAAAVAPPSRPPLAAVRRLRRKRASRPPRPRAPPDHLLARAAPPRHRARAPAARITLKPINHHEKPSPCLQTAPAGIHKQHQQEYA
jgi:hypothetical protein